eukprot:scaffold144791_cov22-Tisochrysis_lutea.AAC.2
MPLPPASSRALPSKGTPCLHASAKDAQPAGRCIRSLTLIVSEVRPVARSVRSVASCCSHQAVLGAKPDPVQGAPAKSIGDGAAAGGE